MVCHGVLARYGCVKQIGNGLEGSRGGRVVWTCNDQLLAVTGFDRFIPFDSCFYCCCLHRHWFDSCNYIHMHVFWIWICIFMLICYFYQDINCFHSDEFWNTVQFLCCCTVYSLLRQWIMILCIRLFMHTG